MICVVGETNASLRLTRSFDCASRGLSRRDEAANPELRRPQVRYAAVHKLQVLVAAKDPPQPKQAQRSCCSKQTAERDFAPSAEFYAE